MPTRRQFLRAAGVAVALPRAATAGAAPPPRRFLAVCNNLGLLADQLVPATAGRDYQPSPYLQAWQHLRADFTVLSGLSHPGVDGAHAAEPSFLTAAPHPGTGSFRNTISLDQHVAERVGAATRLPSLTLAVNSRTRTLSFSGAGVGLPPEDRAAGVFRQLFVQGSPAEVDAQVRRLETGASVLDAVLAQAAKAQKAAAADDRPRLDQYFTGVRELEQRLHGAKAWERRPKPPAPGPPPADPDGPAAYFEKVRLMYDVVRLAFACDGTRTVSLLLNSLDSPVLDVPGGAVDKDYHDLSHHGRSEAKRDQLKVIDRLHLKLLGDLVGGLKATAEGDGSLLDRTVVLYGSHLGDANLHTTTNLLILLAGGGFKHSQHLAFSPVQNAPLANLFVSVLHRLGLPADRFATSTGPLRGLDFL